MMKRLKVLMVAPKFFPTPCGVGDYTASLIKELSKKEIDLTLLTRQQNCPPNWDHVPIIQGVRRWKVFNPVSLQRLIHSTGADLIHLQYEPFGFRQSFEVPLFFAFQNIPVVTTVHEVWHRYPIHRWRDSILYSKSKHIIVNDEGCFDRLLKIAPRQNGHVTKIGVGSNIPLNKRYSQLQGPPFTVGYFGFLNMTKKVDVLLRALAVLIFEKKLDVHLKLIGEQTPETRDYRLYLQDLCRKLNIADHVEFLSGLTSEQIPEKLMRCHCVVLPFIDGVSSRRGTFQACAGLALPIITTPPQNSKEKIDSGKTALFANGNDPQDMASVIQRVLANEELRRVLSEGALEYSSMYSWQKISQQHLEIYQKLLDFGPV